MSTLKHIVLTLALMALSAAGLRAQQAPIFTNYTNSYA